MNNLINTGRRPFLAAVVALTFGGLPEIGRSADPSKVEPPEETKTDIYALIKELTRTDLPFDKAILQILKFQEANGGIPNAAVHDVLKYCITKGLKFAQEKYACKTLIDPENLDKSYELMNAELRAQGKYFFLKTIDSPDSFLLEATFIGMRKLGIVSCAPVRIGEIDMKEVATDCYLINAALTPTLGKGFNVNGTFLKNLSDPAASFILLFEKNIAASTTPENFQIFTAALINNELGHKAYYESLPKLADKPSEAMATIKVNGKEVPVYGLQLDEFCSDLYEALFSAPAHVMRFLCFNQTVAVQRYQFSREVVREFSLGFTDKIENPADRKVAKDTFDWFYQQAEPNSLRPDPKEILKVYSQKIDQLRAILARNKISEQELQGTLTNFMADYFSKVVTKFTPTSEKVNLPVEPPIRSSGVK